MTNQDLSVSQRLGSGSGKHTILERVQCWRPFSIFGAIRRVCERRERILLGVRVYWLLIWSRLEE